MCSNENWMGVLGGLAAAAVILVSAYAEKHSAHAPVQTPPAVSAPAQSGAPTQTPAAS